MGSFITALFQKIQEQTKALVFVFGFIFVLVDEQAISTCTVHFPRTKGQKFQPLVLFHSL